MQLNKLVSIVIPAYNEQENIFFIYEELYKVINNLGSKEYLQEKKLEFNYDYEIIFVNDWSKDKTWENIVNICTKDNKVKGITFSRNFWKEIAMTAWLELSKWDVVITLDCDGQHPVEKLPVFLYNWEQWYDIVFNKRPKIDGASFLKKISSKAFYFLFNSISDFKLEAGTTDYRLLDRKVVDTFLKLEEKNRIYRWLIDWLWYNKIWLEFNAKARVNWQWATYNYFKLIKLALDSITSFSLFPLKVVWYLWFFITIISWWLLFLMFVDKVTKMGLNFTNLAIVTVINTFLIGIVLMSLWMIALYIANIHDEVRKRPLYIIKDKVNF